jgi:hypothetical protein
MALTDDERKAVRLAGLAEFRLMGETLSEEE